MTAAPAREPAPRAQPITVLVLIPSIGGYWFGELLAGLTREVAGAGGRIVLVQTLEAGTRNGEVGEPGLVGDFATPVAWSEVDGVVSIASAVSASYLRQLRAAGKPVVLASAAMADFDAPVALPDNRGGAMSAVEHLIEHGHTRIGFVGNLAQPDVRGRLAGYRQALDKHALAADPTHVFSAPDNARAGGVRAAQAVLTTPNPPSALMVATDRNAIGLMRTLTDAGLNIPRDIAIVAFDNIEAAAFATPTLSSVNQRFDETGALAGRLVLAQIRGEAVPCTVFTPPSVRIAARESCGCATDAPERAQFAGASTDLLRDELHSELSAALLTDHDAIGGPQNGAVLAAVHAAEHLLASGDDVTAAQIRLLTSSMRRLAPRPDLLRRITGAMTQYVERRAGMAQPGDGAAVAGPARISAALWRLQAVAFLRQSEANGAALDEQFVVDAGLLDADPGGLSWLVGTRVRAGALALWQDSPALLRIAGTYDPAGVLACPVGSTTTPERFPPATLVATSRSADRDVCVVVPVRTKDRDWGLLAVVGQIDTAAARETYHHWAALLCTSLESERLQEAVRKSALYDALTGLPNRRLFLDRLEQSVALWHRCAMAFAVIFLDLDGFKAVNDTLGHHMGDRVLTEVGTRICAALRTVDTGARFGGDEFAILLHDVDAADVMRVVQRVQADLAEPLVLDGHEIAIRASFGVATSGVEYACAEDVLRDADAAMYRAKAAERGSVSFFDAAMHARTMTQHRLHVAVQQALAEHQFELQYQPVVNLGTGRTDRFEALVRWRHPTRGALPPQEFLPLMDDAGLIVALGRWIIDEVCRQLAAWGSDVQSVSIKISDREFWDQCLLTHVHAALERHHLTGDRLTFEISEDMITRRPEAALRRTRELHDAGLRLHIGDFGTGRSSLATLRRFPVDALKIDCSVIDGLAVGGRSAALVSALVATGRALGVGVITQGVRTDEQLAFLAGIGCATGQGLALMPAVGGHEVTDLLERAADPGHPKAIPA